MQQPSLAAGDRPTIRRNDVLLDQAENLQLRLGSACGGGASGQCKGKQRAGSEWRRGSGQTSYRTRERCCWCRLARGVLALALMSALLADGASLTKRWQKYHQELDRSRGALTPMTPRARKRAMQGATNKAEWLARASVETREDGQAMWMLLGFGVGNGVRVSVTGGRCTVGERPASTIVSWIAPPLAGSASGRS